MSDIIVTTHRTKYLRYRGDRIEIICKGSYADTEIFIDGVKQDWVTDVKINIPVRGMPIVTIKYLDWKRRNTNE